MNPYALLVVFVLWAASLAGIGWWQNGEGHAAERVVWQARESVELNLANAKILATEEKYRSSERQHGIDQAAISGQYQKELNDAKNKTDALIAAAHAGTYRLSYRDTSACSTAVNPVPGVASSAAGSDATSVRGLPADIAENLYALTGRCNDTRDQLTACQKIITLDRR